MEAWLRCSLSPGQFSNELVAVVCSAQGREFSLFVPKSDLDYNEAPTGNRSVEGWVRVKVVESEDNLFVIRLPRVTLENGQYLTVNAGQFRSVPEAREVSAAR
jgi:hypothetical protein